MRIDVLGVGFDNVTMAEAVERGLALLRSEGAHYVVTPNPEIVEVCRENEAARAAVNGADLVLPDGIGVIKGAAMLGTPLKEKTPGIEFASHLMGKMAGEGMSLYLLGAKPGVAASQMFVNAPFLIGKEVGSAEYAAENGLSSLTAENEADAFAKVRELVALLPSNCEEVVETEETADDANRSVAVEGLTGKDLLSALADRNRFLETGASYAPEMVTGFARLGGVCCGFVANNASVKGGVLTADAAKKAAKLVSFCDSFGIPVVTLTDSEGVAVSRADEGTPLAAQLGKLAMAYASANTAKITVVTGKAYGASFTLMGSRALGADLVYALPDASVSVMDPEAAVAFLWNDRVTAEKSRAALAEEWKATCASPANAAADGSIDDVISSAELRSRLCSAVYMLMMKNTGTPARRHCNLPL